MRFRLKLNYIPINIPLHTTFIVSVHAKEFPAGRHSQFLPCFSADRNAQIAADLKHVEKAHRDLYFFHD